MTVLRSVPSGSLLQVLLRLWVLLAATVSSRTEEATSPEALFRTAAETWQRKHSRGSRTAWEVWKSFAKTLVEKYELLGTESSPASARAAAEIVGAMEEGILAIERTIFRETQQQPSGDDIARDSALAAMYTEYGRLLLNSSEPPPPGDDEGSTHRCFELARDPHTLLIGAPERLNEYKSKQLQGSAASQGEAIHALFGPLCRDNAENALRNALSLDATLSEAEVLLETITGMDSKESVHARKPKEFVAELFDSFAETFDEKLVGTLGYRVPQIIGETVGEILGSEKSEGNARFGFGAIRNVLDAGCGTGLAGRELRKAIDGSQDQQPTRITLVGVDASQKMLDIAKKCTTSKGCGLPATPSGQGGDDTKLYDALLDLDLEEMTLANTLSSGADSASSFELIVAADVFVYFGSLEQMMVVLSELSHSDGGLLVFTCERATEEEAPLGFRLLPTGRFAHTKGHVLGAASEAGYSLLRYNQIVPRTEKGVDVDGHLFVFAMDGVSDEKAAEL
ncbi:unnamed protein product [Pseudo-nitzschia multistriata]|uniref:Methyltransferase domain-containing protein n=1 Tax=Pseudo-nitzschia multistriata TaxID=183589 RepID=A0A448Z303_9STRA|nr:unnamed protein product [Pseudo-nitzschia multistriata]